MGARLDMVRGLPIIHLNFLGYDEQAHRRGPASAFAHWSLRGIDHAIRRTWRAARRAQRRDYQVWIYSDHGQEAAAAYHELAGRTLQEAVEAAFHGSGDSRQGDSPVFVATTRSAVPESGQSPSPGTVPLAPATLLRGLEPATDTDEGQPIDGLQVAAMGSLGQVYCPAFASPAERDSVARRLVAEAKIPLVLAADGAGQALAWTSQGCFHLPDEAAAVLGAGHPFLARGRRRPDRLVSSPRGGPTGPGWLGLPGPRGQLLSRERCPRRPQPRRDAGLRDLAASLRRWAGMTAAGCGPWTSVARCWKPSAAEEGLGTGGWRLGTEH